MKFPVYRPWLGGNVKKYVGDCLDTGWISSRGPYVERFEKAFAGYIGANDATSVFNGTVALHLALTALGIGPGDEVLVPAFTYVASVNTILQTGAKPVFVDSLPETLQLDVNSCRNFLSARTKAVMAVHIYGHPCDLGAISDFCTQNGLLLVEDAAEAFGSRWNGVHVGTFGDAATFSFFGNKTITTGEGGMVIAKDADVLQRCRHLKAQGVSATAEYWHDALAFNYRMTNIQAAIGLAQLEIAEEVLARKSAIAEWYRAKLAGLPLRSHDPVGVVTHSHWMCSIIVESHREREAMRAHLAAEGIETRPFFPPAHRFPHCLANVRLPVAENISGCGINLPSYPELTQADIKYISAVIRRFYER